MPEYADDLALFLNALGQTYEKIHILSHSCGAHLLFINWLRVREEPCRWSLGSLTLVNPDVVMEIARPLLPDMARDADVVTIYVDENDRALYSSWLSQSVFPDFLTRQSLSERVVLLGATLDILSHMSPHGPAPIIGDPSFSSPSTPFNKGETIHDQIDIINCSDIEQNVHNMRHCYYMLNTQMVADICQVIGEGRRACDRNRLVRIPELRRAFTFACPPGGYTPD